MKDIAPGTSGVFDNIKDSKEEILWTGKPNAFCFVFYGIPFLALGLVWGCIDLFLLIQMLHDGDDMGGFGIPFLLLHAFPFWGSLLFMGWLWMAHGKTFYAYSNRRLLVRTGAIGTDTKTYDYDQLSNLEVRQGPIQKSFNVGTISFNTGQTDSKGRMLTHSFRAIPDAFEVFKKIKEVSMDVKTDEFYPNAKRPSENEGYKTRYTPRG